MANWIIQQYADLGEGINADQKRMDIMPIAYPGDDRAHVWQVTVLRNGSPVEIADAHTVSAYFFREYDGQSVLAAGTIVGSVCSVALPQEVYAYPCRVTGIMRLNTSGSGENTTIGVISFHVGENLTGAVIDPGDVIPSIDDLLAEIDRMEAATDAAEDVVESVKPEIGRLNSLSNDGSYAIQSSDLESGYWAYSTKASNSKRLRNAQLIPVRAGMVIRYTNPTMKVYFGVLATETSSSYLQVTGWLPVGAENVPVIINYDGYMVLNLESSNNITPSDYDCEISLSTKMEGFRDAFGAFAGLDPMNVSATFTGTNTTVDLPDVFLVNGVQYGIYVTETIPTGNTIRFYVIGDATNAVVLNQGENVFTPAISGYLRLYNVNASYVGPLHLTISSYNSFVTSHTSMILTSEDLSALTNGSMSCNDFPYNKIVCVGNAISGMQDKPFEQGLDYLGTYVTLSHRGYSKLRSGAVQMFFGANGAMAYRMCWGLNDTWREWKRPLTTGKSYLTREAWLADYPSDLLADLPQMTGICIAAPAINPADGPRDNFTGMVYTLGYRTRLNTIDPGDYQIAFGLNDTLYYRHLVYSAGGNYMSAWHSVSAAAAEYHVGANREYTSLSALLLDLKEDSSKKTIYIHEGNYDIWQEYLDLIAAEKLPDPPDSAQSPEYTQYSVFVPDNTTIIGLGNVELCMEPSASLAKVGESHMWSPLNIGGNAVIENVTVRGHNCRYCLHNDNHNAVQAYHQHYKHCRFIYTLSDVKDGVQLGYNNTIGFGLALDSEHVFDDCEITFIGAGNYSAYYGHENNTGKNGTLLLRNCIISGTSFDNTRVIRLQTLGTQSGHVRAFFENCYIKGNMQYHLMNDVNRNNFETTFVNCNRVAVTRLPTVVGADIIDPFTVRQFNPLPSPTEENPLLETDHI